MRLFVIPAIAFLMSGFVHAEFSCEKKDGVIPGGTFTYTVATQCDRISKTSRNFVQHFEYTKIKAIWCGDTQYLTVKVHMPGYNPPESIQMVNAEDVIQK